MVTIEEIQRRYAIGFITSIDAVLSILCTIADDGSHSLDDVSEELMPALAEYLEEYDPAHGVIGAEPPTEHQVNIAKQWLVSLSGDANEE